MHPKVYKEIKALADNLMPHQRNMSPIAAAIDVVLEGWLELQLHNGRDLPGLIERFRGAIILLANFISVTERGGKPVDIKDVHEQLFATLYNHPMITQVSKKDPFSREPVSNSGLSKMTMLRLPILSNLIGDRRVETCEMMSSSPLFFDGRATERMLEYRNSLPEKVLRGTNAALFPQEQFFPNSLVESFYSYGESAVYMDHHTTDRGAGRTFPRNGNCTLTGPRINLAVMGYEPYEVTDSMRPRLVRHLKQAYGITPKDCERIAVDWKDYLRNDGDPDVVRIACDVDDLLSGRTNKMSTILECDMPSCGIMDGAALARHARFNVLFNMADSEWRHCRHIMSDFLGDPTSLGGGIRFLVDRNYATHGKDLDSFLARSVCSEEEGMLKSGMSPVNYGAMEKTLACAFLDLEADGEELIGSDPKPSSLLMAQLDRRGLSLSSQGDKEEAVKWVTQNVARPFLGVYRQQFPWAPSNHAHMMRWYASEFASAMANDGYPSVSLVEWAGAHVVVPHYYEGKKRTLTIRIPKPGGFGPKAGSATVQVTPYTEDPEGYGCATKFLFFADGTKMADCQLSLHKKGFQSEQKFDCVLVGANALGEVNSSMLDAHRILHGEDVLSKLTGQRTQGATLNFSDDVVCIRCGEDI